MSEGQEELQRNPTVLRNLVSVWLVLALLFGSCVCARVCNCYVLLYGRNYVYAPSNKIFRMIKQRSKYKIKKAK